MARRVETAALQVEQKADPNYRRVETAALSVEQKGDPNYRHVNMVGLLIEYYGVQSISIGGEGIPSAEAVGTPTITKLTPPRTEDGYVQGEEPHDEETSVPQENEGGIVAGGEILTPVGFPQTQYYPCTGEEWQTILGVPQVVIPVYPGEKFGPFSPIARRVAGVKAQVIGTKLASLGLSLLVYKPAITPLTSYVPRGTFIGRLEQEVVGWTHSIDITNGYASASIDMQTTREEIEDWLEFGLGRHVELYNEAGVIIWEGFVNQVEANLGALSFNTGALVEVGNIVNVVYTPVDNTIDPPTRGTTTSTVSVANDNSILRFGAIEKTLSTGECTDEDADRYRDTYAKYNAWPQPTKDISLGQGDFSMHIELLGYAAWLNLVGYYNDSISFTTLSQKLADVLASDINGMFSTDYSGIAENLYIVPEAEGLSTQRMMWDVVKSLVAIGDVNDNRYGFGIYAGRKARYFQIPTDEITYRARLDDPSQSIFVVDMSAIVRPWNVLPGRWLQYTDLMSGKIAPVSLFEDQRSVLIEEVSFSFPWGLGIRGGNANPLAQLVAKMGYNG